MKKGKALKAIAEHFGSDLDFVKRNPPSEGGFNYWTVESAGSYTADCELGHRLAEQWLALPATVGTASMLALIVFGIAKAGGEPRGAVVGFMGHVAPYALLAIGGMRGGKLQGASLEVPPSASIFI